MMTRRGDRARDEIVDAARALLLERGIEGFSLREVARHADYVPSALYNHFPSRDALLAAVGLSALDVLGRFLAEVLEDLPPEERAVELGMAYVRFAREMRPHFDVVFNRLTVPSAGWAHFSENAWPFTVIVACFADGVAAGVFRAGPDRDPAQLAFGLWALAHGAATLRGAHLAAVPEDIEPMVRAALTDYVAGVQ